MPDQKFGFRRKRMTVGKVPGDRTTAYAVLDQQVENLEGYVDSLSNSIVSLDRKVTDSINLLGSRMEAAIGTVNTKLDEKSKTHWPTLIAAGSLIVAIMTALGGLAYLPIKANQDQQHFELREQRTELFRLNREQGKAEVYNDLLREMLLKKLRD